MAACAIESMNVHHQHVGITMDFAGVGSAEYHVQYDCMLRHPLSSISVADYLCACAACRSAMTSFLEMYLVEVPIAARTPEERTSTAKRILTSFSRQLMNVECDAIADEVDVWRVWRLVNRCAFCAEMLRKWNTIAGSRLIPQLCCAIDRMHIKA
jgi:hypothetical protein